MSRLTDGTVERVLLGAAGPNASYRRESIAPVAFNVEQSIAHHFEHAASKNSHRLAIQTTTAQLTSAQLNALANKQAHALLARNLPLGFPIGGDSSALGIELWIVPEQIVVVEGESPVRRHVFPDARARKHMFVERKETRMRAQRFA